MFYMKCIQTVAKCYNNKQKKNIFSRKNNFGLIIALDENGEAKGSLFRDDDESLDTVESSKFNHIVYAYSKVIIIIDFFFILLKN